MKSIRPDQIFTIKPLFDTVLSPPRKGYVRGNKALACVLYLSLYKQKPCIELFLYTWLFFTYSFLIFYYSIISKQKEHIQTTLNPKDVHDGH